MPTFEGVINDLRAQIKAVAKQVDDAKKERNQAPINDKENRGEVMADLTLSYRHLEDASMRLGKVLQYLNGGESVYDSNVVGHPEGESEPERVK
jgi:hypothetical protein